MRATRCKKESEEERAGRYARYALSEKTLNLGLENGFCGATRSCHSEAEAAQPKNPGSNEEKQ